MISLVAAIGKNRELGKDNQLLWNLPNDLKYFKRMTEGKIIVLGANTYKGLGKPLPNRTNLILSRSGNVDYHPEIFVYNSVEDILYEYETYAEKQVDLIICGGEQIYKEFLPHSDKLYLTVVDGVFPEADTHFPAIGDEWKCVSKEQHWADDKNEYDHCFCVYEKE